MKQNLRRAVNLSALVLTAWLLMGLFMGCPNGSGPNRPNESAQPKTVTITVKGDERIAIPSDNIIKTDLAPAKTWSNIKADVESKINLKIEWQGGDYEIYEWRLGGETGEKISDDYPINNHITVYAVTNYAKFNIEDNKIKLTSTGKGYTGSAPRGKIIIPDGITEIEHSSDLSRGAFNGCTEITSIYFTANLTRIGGTAFFGCTGLTSVEFPASLTAIGGWTFYKCNSLTSIEFPANLTEITLNAFYDCAKLTRAVFADKKGWAVYDDAKYINKHTDIDSTILTNTSIAAKYLRNKTNNGGYCNQYWKKN